MSDDDRRPVLVGVGQVLQRDADPGQALGPLELMAEAARRAAEDAGGGRRLLSAVDWLATLNTLSWRLRNGPRGLAETLGAHPTAELTTAVGGNMPQSLVNVAAREIQAGRVRVALIAGAEAVRSLRRARRAGSKPSWSSGGDGQPTLLGDERPGNSDHEGAHGLTLPAQIYPLFENALRAKRGLSLEAHRAELGRLYARFTRVAAKNPYAWFPLERTADEIARPTPSNRMIAFPYTKLMNAILDVDQGAALLLTSAAGARALGVPEARWIHWWGGGDAHEEPWFPTERGDLAASPALRAAGARALAEAGVAIGDVRHLDLYSCFPCAVQIARDMLGIAPDDPRELTVTGGLAYAGGPGNSYVLHSIACLVERLRADRDALGLVTAVGWFLTKHAAGVYASRPRPAPDVRARDAALAAAEAEFSAARDAAPAFTREPQGHGRIVSYTVLHDREGRPERGVVVGGLEDGRRFLALTPPDAALLEALEQSEGVGRTGRVERDGAVNRFTPD